MIEKDWLLGTKGVAVLPLKLDLQQARGPAGDRVGQAIAPVRPNQADESNGKVLLGPN